MPPDVLARVRYYEVGAAKRTFYSSGQKGDYLGYIKGVQSMKMLAVKADNPTIGCSAIKNENF